MRSLVLFLMLAPMSAFSAERDLGRMCLQEERIKISEVNAKIELADRKARVASIVVKLPVDCRTRKYLVPDNYITAVDWLDVALPIELKASLLYGEYAEPAQTSNYGVSVMSDIHQNIGRRWGLGKKNATCAAPIIQGRSKEYETPCFYVLIDLLRERYLKGAGLDRK